MIAVISALDHLLGHALHAAVRVRLPLKFELPGPPTTLSIEFLPALMKDIEIGEPGPMETIELAPDAEDLKSELSKFE